MTARKRAERAICYCVSYPFPHRAGGGKCSAYPHAPESLCACCGLPADTMTVDFGIGAYEYWGSKGIHSDVQEVTACCESDFVPNRPGSFDPPPRAKRVPPVITEAAK